MKTAISKPEKAFPTEKMHFQICSSHPVTQQDPVRTYTGNIKQRKEIVMEEIKRMEVAGLMEVAARMLRSGRNADTYYAAIEMVLRGIEYARTPAEATDAKAA